MATATVNGVRFESDRPCAVHTVTWNGRTFTAGAMLLAALFAFQDWLDLKHPNLYVYVIQGAYNTDVPASAGSHDRDGAVDVAIVNRKTGRRVWFRGIRWWRTHHFYSWLRNSGSWASPSQWHFHQIVVGIINAKCPVGDLIPGQVNDAIEGKTGLVGHLLDPTWRQKHYKPFPYAHWVSDKEDEMTSPKNWDADDWAAVERHVGDAPLNVKLGGTDKEYDGWSLRRAVKTLLDRTKGTKS